MEVEGTNLDKSNIEMKKIEGDDKNEKNVVKINNENPRETWSSKYEYYFALLANTLSVDIAFTGLILDQNSKLNSKNR